MTVLRDLIFIVGFFFVEYGLHAWWSPAAFIVGGAAAMVLAYLLEFGGNDRKHTGPRG